MTPQEILATQKLGSAVLEAIAVNKEGVGSGVIYSALLDKVTLNQYQQLLNSLTRHRFIHEDDCHVLTITDAGVKFQKTLSAKLLAMSASAL